MAHISPVDHLLAGFTDTQWYMYHQRNVAFYAAFAKRSFSRIDLMAVGRALVAHAPQLSAGFSPAGGPLPDDVLARVVSLETVKDFEGFPESPLNAPDTLLDDKTLPLFRIRIINRHAGADGQGRSAYVQVRVCHSLVEGADSAQLSRSQPSDHAVSPPDAAPLTPSSPPMAALAGTLAAGLHLIAGNLLDLKPGGFAFSTRTLDRAEMGKLARALGVRQRALLFGLAMATVFAAGSADGKKSISSTYSVIDRDPVVRDRFMRMRMRFATFRNQQDLPGFIRHVDRALAESEARESPFQSAMNAAALATHRRLSGIVPFAYTPRLFRFMPFDIILGLIPPHRLTGELTEGLIEPVYAGAETPGGNACVIVPNRHAITFNFYLQHRLLPCVDSLEHNLAELRLSVDKPLTLQPLVAGALPS